jgi:phage tail-like protein
MALLGVIDPIPGFHFVVNFFGVGLPDIDMRFHDVSGLTSELETLAVKEGGENRFVHKLPVRTKHSNLVLKRAIYPVPSTLVLWARNAIYNLDIIPVDVQIFLLNDLHIPVKGWNFTRAYAVKIQYSDLKAQENTLMIETLEMAYQNVEPLSF